MEAIVAIVGAILGLFIFRFFGQKRVESGQRDLEAKVEEIRKKDEELKDKDERLTADEDKKIKEITDEQNKDITVDDLVDFFNNRKK